MPNALPPPDGPLVVLDDGLIRQAVEASRESPRSRMILPFHAGHGEGFHRMLNAIQPGSYIRPHRHLDPPKPESVLVLRGALTVVHFTDGGELEAVHELRSDAGAVGVDIRAGVYHTLLATEPDTVIFEAKPGPYDPSDDKAFPSWAPEEGSAAVGEYYRELETRIRDYATP